MKILFRHKKLLLVIAVILSFSALLNCKEANTGSEENSVTSSAEPTFENNEKSNFDTLRSIEESEDSMTQVYDSMIHIPSTNLSKTKGTRNTTGQKVDKTAKGVAMIYCPAKMIEGLPSIVNATITKEEITAALKEFKKKIGEQNPDINKKEIENDTKSETINLFEKMGVKLEFDPEVFKVSPKETVITKTFGDKKQLDWEWEIIPLHTTERSYIHFTFYYADTANNTIEEILNKRISVDVKVDNRKYLDKWRDFIIGDPKNTTTVIIIPFASFLVGFFSRKKNKKDP